MKRLALIKEKSGRDILCPSTTATVLGCSSPSGNSSSPSTVVVAVVLVVVVVVRITRARVLGSAQQWQR